MPPIPSKPERPSWVWVALSLQALLACFTVYGVFQWLPILNQYPSLRLQFVVRELAPLTAVVALIGLWRDRHWGWILACLSDAVLCVQALGTLLNDSAYVFGHPLRFLSFSVWQVAALAVLFYRPVRNHFLLGPEAATIARPPSRTPPASFAPRWFRLIGYFAAGVLMTCLVTSFVLAVFMGQKHNDGGRIFLLLFYFSLTTGLVGSILFVALLTLAARMCGPQRLWLWMLLGALLAPCLITVLALMGSQISRPAPGAAGLIFWAPMTLFQVWWLTPLVGVSTGWICSILYPWAFQQGPPSAARQSLLAKS